MILEGKFWAVMAFITAALGFIAPTPDVLTGYAFATAGGFAGMAVSPPHERLGVFVTLFLALLFGTFAGLGAPAIGKIGLMEWTRELPLQWIMGFGGLVSRPAARRAANMDFSPPWKMK